MINTIMFHLRSILLAFTVLIFSIKINAQTGYNEILYALKTFNNDIKVSKKDTFIINYIECQNEFNKLGIVTSKSFSKLIDYSPLNEYQKALTHIVTGDYYYSNKKSEISSYLNEYEIALRIAKINNYQ